MLCIQSDWLNRWATLSHGERKRAQIATALWLEPDVLAVDEPTNHLDVKCVARLKTAIAAFTGTVVFVSHDKNFIAEVADRTVDFEKLFD